VSELILPTKLFMPPQRPLLVSRPRLLERLEQERNGKLTLVSAPAGFGKTTLVSEWIASRAKTGESSHPSSFVLHPFKVAWLSLDENDNDFPRFFTYFIAAAQTVYPELAQGLLASLRMSPPVDDGAILPALLHEMATLERPLLLVLDDYHVIHNEAIHEALSRLIDFMPPTLQLAITSREEPPLPLPRWRVRGQLTEIRAADLRFTEEEAAAFLQQTMGLELDKQAVATLENRTEGWVAGLQLAALSLRDEADSERFIADFGGSSRHVADYLLEEVLYQQAPDVQTFLQHTAILERFNADLGDFLLDVDDGAPENEGETGRRVFPTKRSSTILEHLEQANLFLIPLDAHRRWYRYHHLFAQLLQDRLLREQGNERLNRLHRRASRWFEAEGLVEEAVEHALQGKDFDGAARLLASLSTDTLWDQGNTSLFKRWGQSIPTDSMLSHPRSLIVVAAAHLITGDIHPFYSFLALCEGIDSIYGEYALLKCTLVRNEGDFGQALHLAQEAGEFLPEGETTLRAIALMQIVNNLLRLGDLDRADRVILQARELIVKAGEPNSNIHLQAIQLQGVVCLLRADLFQAQRLYREGLAFAERVPAGTPPMVGMMYAELGRVHYEWNELAESAANYAEARSWADRTGISDILVATMVGEVQLLCQRGDAAAAETHLEELGEYARQGRLQDMIVQTESMTALFYLRLGRLDESIRWANSSAFQLGDRPEGTQRYFYQIFVAVRLAECRALGIKDGLSQMSALLHHLFEQAMAGHYRQDMIEILILQALVLDYGGDNAAARQALQRALDLAQPNSLVRTFVDAGPALAPLLAQMDGPYARRLYLAFGQEMPEEDDNGAAAALNLTPRELEVLGEIVAGLSNKEIEEKLVISRNTVRSHIKNLYGKLGVTSRTQAIRKARELKLL
jgi:LuxR family maltose regulon positive regulatory protein